MRWVFFLYFFLCLFRRHLDAVDEGVGMYFHNGAKFNLHYQYGRENKLRYLASLAVQDDYDIVCHPSRVLLVVELDGRFVKNLFFVLVPIKAFGQKSKRNPMERESQILTDPKREKMIS